MKEFEKIAVLHRARYPAMEPQDWGKLAFQSEFGPEHLVSDRERVLDFLRQEWQECRDCPPIPPEPIGNGLCRVHLSACREEDLPRLAEAFCCSAAEHKGTRAGLEERLACVQDVPGMEAWLEEYRRADCPPVRHSQIFRDAYAPHYRVVKEEYIAEWTK